MLSFSRSQKVSRVPGLLSIYLKACGLSARAFDALHALGITMSHSWSVRAYAGISAKALQDLEKVIRVLMLAWWLAYDNVNFAFQVGSQRRDNQSHFDSGTVGSILVKLNAPPSPPLSSTAIPCILL